MWKAAAGTMAAVKPPTLPQGEDDDWETDPDFVNDVTEQEQRWGAKTVEGSGRTGGTIDMSQLRQEVAQADAIRKKKEHEEGPKAAYGYGGKFGVQKDRMDQSAVGHDYVAKVEKHQSQKDYATGFGGKFGVQTDRVDKSAAGWDHKEKLEKHTSQKDYSSGFGGKFGVQSDRQDKSAVGWDHVESVQKHESQKDYAVGFGGKFGVQSDRQDKSAVGWDHHEGLNQHESQVDGKKGFGGKYGVQSDRVDKSAHGFGESQEKVGTSYQKHKPDIGSSKPSSLRAKFENLAKQGEEDNKKRAEEERQRRLLREQSEKDAARKQEEDRLKLLRQKDEEDAAKMALSKQSSTPAKTDAQPTKVQSPVSEAIQRHNEAAAAVKTPSPVIEKASFAEPGKKIQQASKSFEREEQPEPKFEPKVEPKVEPKIEPKEEPKAEPKVEPKAEPKIQTQAQPAPQPDEPTESSAQSEGVVEEQDGPEETGITAVAIYDYQAAADDEISFDPDEIITNVEMIDEGWWRGVCRGKFGLFPANYVQLQD